MEKKYIISSEKANHLHSRCTNFLDSLIGNDLEWKIMGKSEYNGILKCSKTIFFFALFKIFISLLSYDDKIDIDWNGKMDVVFTLADYAHIFVHRTSSLRNDT